MRNLSSKGSLASLMPLFSECMNAFLTQYKSYAFKDTEPSSNTSDVCMGLSVGEAQYHSRS